MSDLMASARPMATSERSAAGKRRNRRVRIDVAADDRERLPGSLASASPGDQAKWRARIAGLDRDVLADGHPFDEAEILMNECDRQPISRTGRTDPSGERDLARVGFVDARQNLDQGRLAGAILTEQRVNLATTEIKIDVIKRARRGETLDEPGHH